ncbi:MAG: methyltransferase domain-containing protein [Nanoarchaeota archaeon]
MDKRILKVLKEIEDFGKDNYMFNVPRETGELLNFLVHYKKPSKILEIGMSNGYSTIWLAEAGFPVFSIEPDDEKIKLAKGNFEKAGLKNINVIKGKGLDVLPKLDEKFDFVFIDAVKDEYLDYFKLLKLDKEAIVVADNIISHDIKDYHEFINKKYKSWLIKISSGVEVTIFSAIDKFKNG